MSNPRRRSERAASAASARGPGGASSSSTSRPGSRRSAATWSRTKTPRPGASGPAAMSERTSARMPRARLRRVVTFASGAVTPAAGDWPPNHSTTGRLEMAYRLMGRLHAVALGAGRRDAGQGTVEYVGLLLLIAVIIGAVVA